MLFDFYQLVKKHRLKIKGIVHAGAHFGEEYEFYQRYTSRVVFIEPCKAAFEILQLKFPSMTLHNFALGASEGEGEMFTESKNNGQSNSLLKPAKHLQQFPEILFDTTEKVRINKLDNLSFDRNQHNFLVMDIQGYELEALKGATWTLGHIDYIYTEVNRDEVYEGCARVEQLDAFLKDFQRVETNWGGGAWGDALYVKRIKQQQKIDSTQFQPEIRIIYPETNNPYFEKYYLKNYQEVDGWTYLPVMWTAYYVNNDYGKNYRAMQHLQNYLNNLDRTKKYYTVVQYDDGILSNVSHLDLRVYAMSGKRIDYPLPLICQPHPYTFNFERNILANFIGRDTHPVRKEIFKLKGKNLLYVSSDSHNLEAYCYILSTSVFTLCPRGYGQTSFRICEAMQFGSIPVYISNEFIFPHRMPFDYYGVICDASKIEETLYSISKEEIKERQERIKKIYQEFFTFEGNVKLIADDLRKSV